MYKEVFEVTIWKEGVLGPINEYAVEASNKFEAVRKAEQVFITDWVEAQTDTENLQRQVVLADAKQKGNAEHRQVIQRYLEELGYSATCTGSIEGFFIA